MNFLNRCKHTQLALMHLFDLLHRLLKIHNESKQVELKLYSTISWLRDMNRLVNSRPSYVTKTSDHIEANEI